jgi:uncharacterized protein (DUF1684 family)
VKPPGDDREREDYEREIARWRERRARRLQSPEGWLTLVDRRVLAEGDNELPLGTITIRGHEARLRVRPGAVVTLGEQPLGGGEGAAGERLLRVEEDAPPESLWFEGRAYELFRRGDVFVVRVRDPNAPARLAFPGITHFPIDPRWRIVARFDRYQPPRHTMHEYDIGFGGQREVPGVARFTIAEDGVSHALSLEPVLEAESNRLFFVFGDLTNRSESYYSGRFLYAEPPAGEEVILDFNTAFNPPCAFTSYATCPVTPLQNRLPVAIRAGERRYPQ